MKNFLDTVLLKDLLEKKPVKGLGNKEISLNWPSYFVLMRCNNLYDSLPPFVPENNLFSYGVDRLNGSDSDTIIKFYDELFVEYLTLIKNLPEVDAFALRYNVTNIPSNPHYDSTLETFKHYLNEHHTIVMHDLILYLAWDRVCSAIATLFEQQTLQTSNLEILKECLIESFIHITHTKKSNPSFFKLCEALWAFQMREEFLDSYSETDWETLAKASIAQKPKEILHDAFYLDEAFSEGDGEPITFFTAEKKDRIDAGLKLGKYFQDKLKKEYPNWNFVLNETAVIYD